VAEALASFITPHQINDEITATVPNPWLRSEIRLYSYSSSHIRSLCGWSVNSSGYSLRGRLRDDVEQNFTHLARAGPDRVALLILQGIDLSVCVQGKNHWFSVHSKKVSLITRAPHDKSPLLFIKTGTLRHEGARLITHRLI